MPPAPSSSFHCFGLVDPDGDYFEFAIAAPDSGLDCSLASIVFTERGPRRKEIATIPAPDWELIAQRVVRELADAMGEEEAEKGKSPTLREGMNHLSPMVGREIAVLLWAIAEEEGSQSLETILHGWRELAREERWWLYSKASMLGQKAGQGWRRALYFALSDGNPEIRVAEEKPGNTQKKTIRKKVNYLPPSPGKRVLKKKAAMKKHVSAKKAAAKKKTPQTKAVAGKKTPAKKATAKKPVTRKVAKEKTPPKTKARATSNSNFSRKAVPVHD